MTQDRIQLSLGEDYLTGEVDKALDTLDALCRNLPGLTPEERRRLTKMGDKSESFCRLTADTIGQYKGLMPRDFVYEDYLQDLVTLDQLRPRVVRMLHIVQKMQDTEMLLGSDLMVNSVEAYAYLKVAGKTAGLDAVRQQMSARFAKTKSAPVESPKPGQ